MDYTFAGYVMTSIISAWIGAFVCWKINQRQLERADFWIANLRDHWKMVDKYQDEVIRYRAEKEKAEWEVAKLERKLGQVVHAQEEFNRLANEALEAAQARPPAQTVLAPHVTDATTWKALLLACNAVAEATDEKPEPDVWVQHFLGLAASNKDTTQ